MSILTPYINRAARNQLVFTSYEVEGINYVDIGHLLSRKIEGSIGKKRLPMIADIELNAIMDSVMNVDERIGNYIAIKNIGILFEPALQIDLKAFLDKWSRGIALIVYNSGEIKNDCLYLAKNYQRYCVNLSEITYKSL